ncbi:methylated-DNA--[protein]-cysteine S-methyltransferase [Candidatus Woesebacteria bacterium]|nr:MAG: methylated-DNA--[protein]-cysteine S-methyltransferase [Candidatus Woesebacteria bacterium]
MKKTQVNSGLFQNIYEIVRCIPVGFVATYGQVAEKIGTKDARKVGWALSVNSDPSTPCHRVIYKDGSLAKNYGKSLTGKPGWRTHKDKLIKEGITFTASNRVDLTKHLVRVL